MKFNTHQIFIVIALILVVFSTLLIAAYYSQLPDELTLYFNNPNESPNDLYPKWQIWFYPAIAGLFDVFLAINIRNKMPSKNAKILIVLGLMLSIICLSSTINSIMNGLGNPIQFADKVTIVLIIFFIISVICFRVAKK